MDHTMKHGLTQSARQVLPSWYAVAKLWFYSSDKWKARAYMVSVLVLAYLNTVLSVKISYAQRNFSTALSEKRPDAFRAAVMEFVVIIAMAAPCTALTGYIEQRLMLAWRTYLTETLLAAYFSDRAFFNIKQAGEGLTGVDNPDQRVCDDVRAFVDSSVAIVVALVLKVFKVVAFAGVLWSISPSLVYFLLLYTGFGTTALTWIFGRPLMRLYYKSLNTEADMRFSLVRVRENAESIAFYGGEGRERQVVIGRLGLVVAVALQRIKWQSMYELWSRVYSWATILIPPMLTAPRYFAGEIEFGVVSQCSYVFSQVEAALSVIVDRLDQLSGLAAQTQRLDALVVALGGVEGHSGASSSAAGASAAAGKMGPVSSPRAAQTQKVLRLQTDSAAGTVPDIAAAGCLLVLERLSVCTPGSKHVICRDLDLRVASGESLLVVGPSGCGKSSLLRVVAGLWVEGSGTIIAPDPASLFFLPQKPYMPLGDLRQQLLFPSMDPSSDVVLGGSTDKGSRRGKAGNKGSMRRRTSSGATGDMMELLPLTAGSADHNAASKPSEAELADVLQRVRLPDLIQKCGGLDAELDWSHVLSLGEQQRLAFARLLLHSPSLAFLDEATSALDSGSETMLYQQLKSSPTSSYVSVGHRLALVKFHTHVLECAEGGVWVKSTAADFLRRVEAKDGMQL